MTVLSVDDYDKTVAETVEVNNDKKRRELKYSKATEKKPTNLKLNFLIFNILIFFIADKPDDSFRLILNFKIDKK